MENRLRYVSLYRVKKGTVAIERTLIMINRVCLLSQAARNRLAFAVAVFAVATLGLALPAKADSVTLSGASDPNLQVFININSLTNTGIMFSATNVMVGLVTSSITGIGFDLPGVIMANSPALCAGTCGNFTLAPAVSNSPGNVPQFNTAVLDWALTSGPSGNFAGGQPPGITQGQTATFTVTGNFAGLTQAQFLNGAYVRYQAVDDPAFPNVTSDVAHTPGVPVPEPASVLLLGIGLLGVAATRIRR
jgi:hypothetical protein